MKTKQPLIKLKIKNDKSNTTFGKIKIYDYVGSRGKRAYYNCECLACGNLFQTTFSISNKINSCRKCHKGFGNKHYAWKGYKEFPQNLYTSYKHSAVARGFEFSVSIKYLWDLFIKQNRKCTFTGRELKFNLKCKDRADKTASLDRIDSTKGYIKGNLQWVHKDVNKLKKNMEDGVFLQLCLEVAKHHNKND